MHHPGPSLQFETGLTDRWHSIGYTKISSRSACEPNTSLLYDESHFYVAAVSFFFFFPRTWMGVLCCTWEVFWIWPQCMGTWVADKTRKWANFHIINTAIKRWMISILAVKSAIAVRTMSQVMMTGHCLYWQCFHTKLTDHPEKQQWGSIEGFRTLRLHISKPCASHCYKTRNTHKWAMTVYPAHVWRGYRLGLGDMA